MLNTYASAYFAAHSRISKAAAWHALGMGLATGLPALHQQEGKAMPGLLPPMVPVPSWARQAQP